MSWFGREYISKNESVLKVISEPFMTDKWNKPVVRVEKVNTGGILVLDCRRLMFSDEYVRRCNDGVDRQSI